MQAACLPAGGHVTEQELEKVAGTSRSPVRGALAYLAKRGVLVHRKNRGYFLVRPATEIEATNLIPEATEEQVYLAIARDRLSHALPSVLKESEAIRRYRVPRDRLRRILGRMANEGWVERRPGKGWSFLPMIDSPEAYSDSYEYRRLLEPAGILLPTFKVDPTALARLRTQQEFLHAQGFKSATPIELFEANATFHETIASMTNNRFIYQAVARQNQLRRLIEYSGSIDRERVQRQCAQHLQIIKVLEQGKFDRAAQLMDKHLAGVRIEKMNPRYFNGRGLQLMLDTVE
jgi:DNA-binding GntR family transcriptional regulator